MSKIAFTGGGTVGHVSVNLSLIPTALAKGHEAFYIGSQKGIETGEGHPTPSPQAAVVRKVHLLCLLRWVPGSWWKRCPAERDHLQEIFPERRCLCTRGPERGSAYDYQEQPKHTRCPHSTIDPVTGR